MDEVIRQSGALVELTQRRSASFVQRVPIHFARQHGLLGLTTDDPERLEIFVGDRRRVPIAENLALLLHCEVTTRLADPLEIQSAIDAAYQQQSFDVQAAVDSIESTVLIVEEGEDRSDLLDNAACAPVVRLVNQVLFEAARRRASDVHIQPTENDVAIRFRIDGVLTDYVRPALSLLDELVSRIKVMCALDIAEKRLPQDGRATVRIGPRLIDLRTSVIPTTHGERVVLRLLDKGARLYDLARLGMAEDVLAPFSELIRRSHGLILMTGPTGSGKSTTLYAALQQIDYRRLNVVTIEDPIEYQLPGISQTQVAQRKGMTFATGLRSVLRQDPDVIMVGEIRDEPTARLAIQAALTGHLVLSTLHTNDAIGAVARLIDLGIEPYLVADALLGVGAQRLVRITCSDCAEPVALTNSSVHYLGPDVGELTYQQGSGCERCGGLGYYEREGIFEFLPIDAALRELIHQRAAASLLREQALRSGMRSLRGDGIRKIRAGRTTPEEVLRVTQA